MSTFLGPHKPSVRFISIVISRTRMRLVSNDAPWQRRVRPSPRHIAHTTDGEGHLELTFYAGLESAMLVGYASSYVFIIAMSTSMSDTDTETNRFLAGRPP